MKTQVQYHLKLHLFVGIVLLSMCNIITLHAQDKTFSETPKIFLSGIKMSTQLTVKFREPVLNITGEVKEIHSNSIKPEYSEIKNYFTMLEERYGQLTFIKHFPTKMWGDTITNHKKTGLPVRTKDLSQIYSIKFGQNVPIDSLIYELRQLNEVEYAHQPIQYLSLATPNDPLYTSNQWNLPKINAEKAWDISIGNPSVKVGIIGSGIKSDHEDLDGKVTFGNVGYENNDPHETMVAGVVGASSNNSIGVASLGWQLELGNYYTPNNSEIPFIADVLVSCQLDIDA